MGCVFCGGGPLTREHALPRWLRGPLSINGQVTHRYLEPPDGAAPSREWVAPGLDVKVKAVCKPCNEGWMEQLESTVRPTLTPMVEGSGAQRLSPQQCSILTTWLLKTALTTQLAEPTERQIVRADLYDRLYAERRAGDRLQAWAARNAADAGAASAVRGMQIQRGVRLAQSTWAYALVLRRLTLLLVDLGTGPARPIAVEPPLLHALTPLAPLTTPITFPPRYELGAEQQRLILHLLAYSAR